MRTCKEIEPLMLGYVSGDILNSQKRMLDEHIEECSACQNEILKLQNLDMELIELKEEEPELPEELKDNILNKISLNARKRERHLHRYFSPTAIISVVTVSLMILVFILAGKIETVSLYSKGPKAKSVKILFFSDEAKNVSLVGDFNGWSADDPLVLKSVNGGMWEAELKLIPGMYQYNLIVDGNNWIANPRSKSHVPDGFGGMNSVVMVNGNGENQVEKIGEEI